MATTRAERMDGGSPVAKTTGTANLSTGHSAVLRFARPIHVKRFVAIIAFAGAVILSTHMLAPAGPSAAKPSPTAGDLAFIQQAVPMIDQVNTQVDRLRERLAAPPAYPAPTRDPFRFGKREEPSRPKPVMASVMLPVAPVAAPEPALPRLVAIAATTSDAGVIRTAVLTVGEDVQILKVGDTVSKLEIRSIGTDIVELADPITGRTFRLSLQ